MQYIPKVPRGAEDSINGFVSFCSSDTTQMEETVVKNKFGSSNDKECQNAEDQEALSDYSWKIEE